MRSLQDSREVLALLIDILRIAYKNLYLQGKVRGLSDNETYLRFIWKTDFIYFLTPPLEIVEIGRKQLGY